MIGFILKHPRLMGTLAGLALVAGLVLGARAYLAHVDAAAYKRGKADCQRAQLEADLAAARDAIEETAASAARSLQQTAAIGGVIGRFAGELSARLADLDLPADTFQKARQESADAIAKLPPETDACLRRVPHRSVCVARAEALGFDPDLSCSPG